MRLVPPAPPLLHPTAVTANSVRLQWKQGDNGGSPIQEFVLNFRPVGGEWEEIMLSKKLSTYVVEGLSCGRSYEFFLIGEWSLWYVIKSANELLLAMQFYLFSLTNTPFTPFPLEIFLEILWTLFLNICFFYKIGKSSFILF